MEDGSDENLPKRPKMSQPHVVTTLNHVSDAVQNLFGDDYSQATDNDTVVVSVDKLEAISAKVGVSSIPANVLPSN